MQTLLQKWESFEAATVPANASSIQTQEVRRAFYAGVVAMLVLLKTSSELLDVENRAEYVEGLQNELLNFVQMMKEGKA